MLLQKTKINDQSEEQSWKSSRYYQVQERPRGVAMASQHCLRHDLFGEAYVQVGHPHIKISEKS